MDPKTLLFSPTHEWVKLDGGTATIGISRFAVDQLTDLIMIDLPAPGTTITAGKTFGEVESVKAVSDLYAPVSGEVIAVNESVTKDVQVLADDPFDKGWLIKVKVSTPPKKEDLLDFDSYEKKVSEESD